MRKFSGWLFALAAFVLPLALYVRTLSPTYIPVDSAEFALCMHFWGVCHPPGFPLYVFLGKTFTDFFPFGTLIYKANLFSAVFGAGSVLLVYLTLTELKVRRQVAILVAFILAVSSSFWEYSVAADVFTFATFFIALSLYLTFKGRFYLASFVLGLSASHFYISAIIFPLLIWYQRDSVLKSQRENNLTVKQFSNVAIISLIFLLGFFPQVLMYFRMQENPAINWGHAQGISGFVDFIRRKEFGNIFLISNPVLTFSLFKFFKHIWAFLVNFLTSFGVILPILIMFGAFLGKMNRKNYFFLLSVFLVILLVQLFLLSTIDPLDSNSPFQINKFYLAIFIPGSLLIGISLQKAADRLFENNLTYPVIFLLLLLGVYLFSNYKVNNLSGNYFSQNMVLDALDQLPVGSVAIVVSHIANFGSRYEQLVNNKYASVTVLYFPNEKNRDNESYYPQLFDRPVNSEFVDKLGRGKKLGRAESYILSTIARNLDKKIYILQGSFEENFFAYLKPYIRPQGMWWRLEPDLGAGADLETVASQFDNIRNNDIKYGDFYLKGQQQDSLNYAISYHSTGVYLASNSDYEGAVRFLNKSYDVRPQGDNIKNEIKLIGETWALDAKYDQLMSEENRSPRPEGRGSLIFAKNKEELEKLGSNVSILMNFKKCASIFQFLVSTDGGKAEYYSNLASCLAFMGDANEARANYQKALEIDPTLENAKKGLEVLGE